MIRTRAELEHVRRECRKMVTRRAGLSAGAAVIPIPGVDIGADVSLLMSLLPAINEKFGLSPEQIATLNPDRKKYTLLAITGIGSRVIGSTVSRKLVSVLLKRAGVKIAAKSTVRYVPIIGQAAAAGLSFSAMKLLGNAHVDDCYQVISQVLEADDLMASVAV
ncbi:hypothetical protein [Martelella alba]|uniref:DUF697 domain-containing protein n=1 Tax=Martelella alba TaxID=2590451 RepID=A0ABY2SUU8_9HYPH|nr:hypothetical protein [Martelella alba]TKI08214.1 hypothetical protein FCN80_03435 [Martelella alba]